MADGTKFVFPGKGSIRLWFVVTAITLVFSLLIQTPHGPGLDELERYQIPIVVTGFYIGGYVLVNAFVFVIRGFEQDENG